MNPTNSSPSHQLVLARTLAAPRSAVWRCWTEPALLEQWFCPKPWTVTDVTIDLRAGGTSAMVMRGPNGEAFPNVGVYLEVVKNERLVMTDAYISAWIPSPKPFVTISIVLADAGEGKTSYLATASHWTEADRQTHEEMGFHKGWGICADQLEALAQKIG